MLEKLPNSIKSIFSNGYLNINGKNYPIFAHKNIKNEKETLSDHCKKTWMIFLHFIQNDKDFILNFLELIKCSLGIEIGWKKFQDFSRSLSFFHDSGKINPFFQIEKMNNIEIRKLLKNRDFKKKFGIFSPDSRHSYLSAYFYLMYLIKNKSNLKDNPYLLILPYIIWSHHTRLHNPHSESNLGSPTKFKDLGSLLKLFFNFLGLEDHFITTLNSNLYIRTNNISELLEFNHSHISLLYNLLYSYLIKADSIASAYSFKSIEDLENDLHKFNHRISDSLLKSMKKGFNKKQEEFKIKRSERKKSEINIVRQEIFNEALNNLKKYLENGKKFFYLKVPTGGGKTNTALGLALEILSRKKVTRVIYALPYISILEQNFDFLKQALALEEPSEIRKIHSSTDFIFKKRADNKEFKDKIITDDNYFNYPVICTTNVALFEGIVKFDKKNKYKFSSLANSIIILDEIQTLPTEYWPEFNYLINELSEKLNIYFIVMSATVPSLEELKSFREESPKYKENVSYLIQNPSKYYEEFERNEIQSNSFLTFNISEEDDIKELEKYLDRIFKDNFNQNRKHGLIGVNTIKTSLLIYETVLAIFRENGWDTSSIKLLNSSFLSPYKRNIEKISKEIDESKKFLLISTQSIEAGMDVSFDFVIRDFSPLDSIEQIRGRCNREVNKRKKGMIYLIKIKRDGDFDFKKIYPKRKINITEEILKKNLSYKQQDIDQYYTKIINDINENIKDRLHMNNADNIQNFCDLRYKNYKNLDNTFCVDIIENDFDSYSFFAELDLPLCYFSENEIKFLKDKQSQSSFAFISNDMISGNQIIEYYKQELPNKERFTEKKIFKKEMMSIISKFSFSAYISSKNKNILKKILSKEDRIGPFLIIRKDKIGNDKKSMYSEKYGFHYDIDLDII